MVAAFFTPLPDDGSYLAADETAGPWSPRHQHGGPPSALLVQRAVCVADSSSGISSVLDWDRWSFANVDVDVHLMRPVAGEWVLLEARTWVAETGTGLARSTLHDARGVVGASAQTLVVQPLP